MARGRYAKELLIPATANPASWRWPHKDWPRILGLRSGPDAISLFR